VEYQLICRIGKENDLNYFKMVSKSTANVNEQVLASCMATVFNASPDSSEWNKVNLYPQNFSLVKNENSHLYLNLHEKDKRIWSHEIYFDFDYNLVNSSFHFFEGDEQWIGVSIESNADSTRFYKTVIRESLLLNNLQNSGKELKGKNIFTKSYEETTIPIEKNQVNVAPVQSSKSSDAISAKNENKKKPNIFSSLFSTSSNKKNDKKREKRSFSNSLGLRIEDVGSPTNFDHLSHIGFNPVTRKFDLVNIPSEWQTIFSSAGATEKDLENPETAEFIADFVTKHSQSPKIAPEMTIREAPIPPTLPPRNTVTAPPQSPQGNSIPPPPPPAPNAIKNSGRLDEAPKAAPTNQNNDDRSALLASIRNAGIGVLKSTPKQEQKAADALSNAPEMAKSGGGDMASILKAALAARKMANG
jgi:hypothetical protein